MLQNTKPSTQLAALVLDFDGTMTTVDVGDAVCDRFAPPAWREVDGRWMRREISLPDAQRAMWALVRGTRAELEDYVRQVALPRAGLPRLLAAARARGYRIVVASGGFDFCFQPVLAALPAPVDAVHGNTARWTGDRVTPVFNTEGLACATCAVCKGLVCDRERAAGARRIVFAGDGFSDRCVVGRADAIAAVTGGALERELQERGASYTSFTDLADVIALLE